MTVPAGSPSHDVEDRADCERLVRHFYARAMRDPLLRPIFVDVAHLDLDEHLPIMTSFWETMLLGHRTYVRQAFGVHRKLHEQMPLERRHFDRWLELWTSSVDALFAGERAEVAKAHATRIAAAFHHRLNGALPPGAVGTVALVARDAAAAGR